MKKAIFKSVFCFVCMLFGINANAQSIYTVNTSSPSACDGAAYFMDSSNTGYDTFVWTGVGIVINSDSSQVNNLCAGTYSVTCSGLGTNGDTTITFVIEAGTVNPCAGFSAYMSNIQHATWGLCDGAMTVSAQGGTTPYTYEWNGAAPTGNTITGLCYNTYNSVTVTDANGCSVFVYGFATDSTNNPCIGLSVNVTTTNITSANVCDGAAVASSVGGTAPFVYSWSNGATTSSVSNLCAGSYTVSIIDSNTCNHFAYVTIYDNNSSTDSSMFVYTMPSSVSADGVCDGQLTVQQWGGVAPYTYSLSNGMVNSTGYFNSLCQGIYSVMVYDSNGDTVYVDAIISNPGNNYNNNTYSDSTYVDSVLSDLQENCQLNYQNIDSVYIAGYNFVGDSIMVYWNVVNTSGAVTVITQTYYIGNVSGVYSLGLQVYCPMKSIGNYFTASDQIYYPGLLGMIEQAMGEVSIYPNPATDQVNVQFAEAGDYEITLFDLTGRTILTQKNNDSDFVKIDVSTLSKGQYTLVINGNNGTMSKSFVK